MTKATINQARTKYSFDKWEALSSDEREPMQETYNTFMGIKNLGEQGAADVMIVIGAWTKLPLERYYTTAYNYTNQEATK